MKHQEFRRHSLCLGGMEAVEARSPHVFGRHMHDQYGIGLILSGAQRSASGRGPVEAGAGDLITVNPGEVHDGAPIGGGRHWCMLYFDPAMLIEATRDLPGTSRGDYRFEAPVMARADLACSFSMLYRRLLSRDAAALAAEEALLLLFGGLGSRTDGPSERNCSLLAQARAAIDDAPEEDHRLARLAAMSGLSRFQFLRAFAAATGLTPHAYLVQRRLMKARRLLARGEPPATTAIACGFADQSHMTRLFRRAYGFTPARFAAASDRQVT
ncbi:hypothetical protein BTR14_20725 [Rhizobium rhizosphaerae]|uniref:HTH araC/xylS-type domain-containing protein n=1 Tax=Xaviernesmea rhizosphaerae TaxID=1672749 RepID=A0ABX3P8Z9_9HYPH|nr:AraC family transcriptional regulator [Xaviernesmea rhizosphaerae]OQP84077.1 hypothetical protein BTR14_20725 [Xaviernesmea rhizosphaerae]